MKNFFIYTISGVLFLSLFLIIILNLALNPNNYKKEIALQISQAIDYNFSFEGDIDLSYSPDVYISVPNIEVAPKDNPSNRPIVKISELKMSLSLIPLLHGDIDVQDITAVKGEFIGFNIDRVILQTYAMLKKINYTARGENSTQFRSLNAKGNIIDNVMAIDYMNIETDLIVGKGYGTINIDKKISSLRIIGKIKDDELTKSKFGDAYPLKLMNKELPIEINGNLDSPSISVDLSSIIKHELEELKDKAIDKIKEKIEDKINLKLPF